MNINDNDILLNCIRISYVFFESYHSIFCVLNIKMVAVFWPKYDEDFVNFWQVIYNKKVTAKIILNK